MHKTISTMRAFLFDLDGTLTIDKTPIPGAVEAISCLKSSGYQIRICTNTTTMSRRMMSENLTRVGFDVTPQEVFSAPAAAVEYLKKNNIHSCYKLLSPDVKSDFNEFEDNETNPQYIVIGDIGDTWDYSLMSRLFEMVTSGATIMALHKGRYWLADGRLKLDIGAFISGLEYATEKPALVIGKPSREFFESAVLSVGLNKSSFCMIGDDLLNDVKGAQDSGLMGVLVRTGKYRQDALAFSTVLPDLILESIAELPDLLKGASATP